jgi:hypothetical protein
MIRRAFVYTILLSMLMHAGCRLGFVDQLYQTRHELAYTIGLIAEIPIAICSSGYDFGKGIIIETHKTETSQPVSFLQVKEISPFYHSSPLELSVNTSVSLESLFLFIETKFNNKLTDSVFHPPARS